MTTPRLTSEQLRVYSFIVTYQQEAGFPPTVREIAEVLGYKSPNNVRQHLRLIEQKGFVRLLAGKARGIEITTFPDGSPVDETSDEENGVPILGNIAAGKPITAIENIEGYLTLDRSIFRGEGLFALRVRGDSMIGMGILNGDIAVLRRKLNAEHGEVVAVVIDEDATLKRFIKENGNMLLRAENPVYSDIILSPNNTIQVVGKLIGVIRKY